jgi:hypothetical protein
MNILAEKWLKGSGSTVIDKDSGPLTLGGSGLFSKTPVD